MEWDLAWLQRMIVTTTVCLPRLLVCFMVLPVVGPMLLPRLVRNSLAVSFLPLLYPLVVTQLPQTITPLLLLTVILKESVLGFVAGYVAALFFWAFQGMGVLIDNQRGSGQSQGMEDMASTESSPLGNLFFQFVTVLFLSAGGLSVFMAGLLNTYKVWPIFVAAPNFDFRLVDHIIELTNQLISAIVLLATPVLIAMFVVTLMMGLINRFAPKLNVFILSMPIKSAVAIFILALYMQGLGTMFEDYLVHFQRLFDRMGEVMF